MKKAKENTMPQRFLPDEPIPTDAPEENYLTHIAEEKWWSFAQETDDANFEKFLADAFPFFGDDVDRKERIKERCGENGVVAMRKRWEDFRTLHGILLSIGGHTTCFVDSCEEDMPDILGRGRFWEGRSKMMKGQPCRCHQNASELWDNNRGKGVSICTGYALSQDGIWRQHSWLHHSYETATQHRTRIIETTEKRVAYFGFMMTQEECEEFYRNNT